MAKGFDGIGERLARRLARGSSRRSLLAKFGAAVVAAPLFPLLPVARAAAPSGPLTDFERNAQSKDPDSCDYWRHCALEGILCGCCGGGVHSCPPGSEPSPTAWVGTCLNPDDGRSYLIAYRDCCGVDMCQPTNEGCYCDGEDRNLPVYRPQSSNDIVWCFGNSSMAYHCSTAVLVGLAK
jgi:methylamine dehydrogenase light chain